MSKGRKVTTLVSTCAQHVHKSSSFLVHSHTGKQTVPLTGAGLQATTGSGMKAAELECVQVRAIQVSTHLNAELRIGVHSQVPLAEESAVTTSAVY